MRTPYESSRPHEFTVMVKRIVGKPMGKEAAIFKGLRFLDGNETQARYASPLNEETRTQIEVALKNTGEAEIDEVTFNGDEESRKPRLHFEVGKETKRNRYEWHVDYIRDVAPGMYVIARAVWRTTGELSSLSLYGSRDGREPLQSRGKQSGIGERAMIGVTARGEVTFSNPGLTVPGLDNEQFEISIMPTWEHGGIPSQGTLWLSKKTAAGKTILGSTEKLDGMMPFRVTSIGFIAMVHKQVNDLANRKRPASILGSF